MSVEWLATGAGSAPVLTGEIAPIKKTATVGYRVSSLAGYGADLPNSIHSATDQHLARMALLAVLAGECLAANAIATTAPEDLWTVVLTCASRMPGHAVVLAVELRDAIEVDEEKLKELARSVIRWVHEELAKLGIRSP